MIATAVPKFATISYPADYSAWRHVTFVLVNTGFAWFFLSRPVWLIWPYAVLTIEVIHGHGSGAWRLWRQAARIDWISVATTIGVLPGLGLLLVDWRLRQRRLRT
jgi:hypothetical protein